MAKKLADYPLVPYLNYYALNRRLARASTKEVLLFLNAEPELAVTEILHKRWLRELGKQRRWQTLRDNFIATSDAELNCFYLRALYGTGERTQALDQTTAMWTQPRSQPKACDPLFEAWRVTDRFTENVVWQRFSAAIMANEVTLANYLIRYFSGSNKTAANAFYTAHVSPSRMSRTSQFKPDTPKFRQVISHGLTRLAARDPKKAAKAWRSYNNTHHFDPPTQQRIIEAIAVAHAVKMESFPTPEQRALITSANTIEELADAALEAQNWAEMAYWIEHLPPDIALKSRWQYWRARGVQLLGLVDTSHHEEFVKLAKQRHYYGFLSARTLGIPGRMNGVVPQASTYDLVQIRKHAGIRRAVELFSVGEDLNGHREWYRALNRINQSQQVLAAELAASLGLVSLAIRTANIAEARDHLHLRFPLAYESHFRRSSLNSNLPTALLFAIARQESAMQVKARSSADARGLMQLLPSTAQLVAKRARAGKLTTAQLYDPATNIKLGSHHLAWLMQRYNGQAPLAIAAYNAGEHRVDRWIKDAQGMPIDVWIERIPFRETRNYVKNVLAFRRVYSDLLATPTPILSTQEQILGSP